MDTETARREAAETCEELKQALDRHGIVLPSLDVDFVSYARFTGRPLIELGRVNTRRQRPSRPCSTRRRWLSGERPSCPPSTLVRMDVGGAGVGLRLASGAFQPLIRRLFPQQSPGAGLVDKPVRVSALVAFKGEKRTLTEKDLRRLSEELVRRAVHAIGRHDAPSDDEVLIVSDVLARSLVRLGELDMDDVQAVRLGHDGLAERIGAPIDLFHSPGTYALYRRLLDQCCLHILNFFTQRSTFVARTLVEQSRQLDQLTNRLDLLVERIGHRSSEDAAFEKRYAEYMQREHSRLTIYGLDLHQEREWPLDDAYLSLEARGRVSEDAPPVRAERALAGQERVLLRGLAGSGKTTLVQWLAVSTARQDASDGSSMTHLLGRVPFVLPMRTLTREGGKPPGPERFLTAVGCPLAAAQPEGWIDRVFSARRGLILIDGIDEIPEAEREDVRRWLRRVNATYPGNLWLVTARPSAVSEDWLEAEAFTELTLAPMNIRDVEAFIQRWHNAADAGDEMSNALLDLVHSRTDLSTLATNPLMCAMICALHRERNRYLPRGRKALYDAALMMLLERRDRERPDRPRGGVQGVELDAETQISLLQKLAYWLANNGRSEMTKAVAASLIRQALPVIHQVGGMHRPRAKQLLQHLLERSGVLREPGAESVDFVHRTFQDYLAAREIVEWQHFPALVARAHEDQWEDVVRMAVAHAQPLQRGEILTALLERGDSEKEHRVRLHLLAMASLEHATQLRMEMRDEVVERAVKFLPPRDGHEAKTLAAAGSIVLELLPGPENLRPEEAEAVVATALEIPSSASLIRLRAFREHPSRDVQGLLAKGWSRFDTHRYFAEITSQLSQRDRLLMPVTNRDELELLSSLHGVRRVSVTGDFTAEDLALALGEHDITDLEIMNNTQIGDLEPLRNLVGLTSLYLFQCPHVTDVSPLAALPIQDLEIFGEDEVSGLEPLSTLRSVIVKSYVPCELSDLPQQAPLERISLEADVPELADIMNWPTLTALDIDFPAETELAELDPLRWTVIEDLPRLRSLSLDRLTLQLFAAGGVCLPKVTSLSVFDSYRSRTLPEGLPEVLPQLRELTIDDPPEDFAPLAALPKLRRVRVLEPCKRVNVPPHIEVTAPPAPRY
ncbi:NACHT domain-containing protein [Streptomyces sp. 6N223]|uniref:NACHT domain-containing protein n=1 Tax=Streptomyces sp. 6N223 TaxID=3457412 RepID=UPI003FD02CBB